MQDANDWDLWWGTVRNIEDGRLQVWRCRADGLNGGRPVVVMTVADARRLRLDDFTTVQDYLHDRFGAGRYRFAPRSANGGPVAGTQPRVIDIDEDYAQRLALQLPSPATASAAGTPMDAATALAIERMRLQAELEREREARRERHREEREERRREREAHREARREEDKRQREADERAREDREERRQAALLGMMEKISTAQAVRPEDPLAKALLSKVLDRQDKRDDLTDFVKVNAEMMRVQAQAQADGFKQLMLTQVEAQRSLTAQAIEAVMTRDTGSGWDGFGEVLASTAELVTALRTAPGTAPAAMPAASAVPSPGFLPPRRRLPRFRRAALPVIPAAVSPTARVSPTASATPATASPAPTARPSATSPLDALHLVRALQQGVQPIDAATLHRLAVALPSTMAQAIRTGDQAALLEAIRPALANDPSLGEWLATPAVAPWLEAVLTRLRGVLGTADAMPMPATAAPTMASADLDEDGEDMNDDANDAADEDDGGDNSADDRDTLRLRVAADDAII